MHSEASKDYEFQNDCFGNLGVNLGETRLTCVSVVELTMCYLLSHFNYMLLWGVMAMSPFGVRWITYSYSDCKLHISLLLGFVLKSGGMPSWDGHIGKPSGGSGVHRAIRSSEVVYGWIFSFPRAADRSTLSSLHACTILRLHLFLIATCLQSMHFKIHSVLKSWFFRLQLSSFEELL